MKHGDNGLEVLYFVPFISFDSQLILSSSQWSDIPGDVIAPSDSLHPVDAPSIHPYEIPGSLYKTIYRYVSFV